jgi:hypothetical protein
MTALLFALAIVAACVALGTRRLRARRARLAALAQPGSTIDDAVAVRSFSEMDEHLARRRCACGSPLSPAGEGSREIGARRYRVARLVCRHCEEEQIVFFETTALLQ